MDTQIMPNLDTFRQGNELMKVLRYLNVFRSFSALHQFDQIKPR